MNSLRSMFGLTVNQNRYLLIVGGWDLKDKRYIRTIESYDIRTDKWTTFRWKIKSDWVKPLLYIYDGFCYVIGGSNHDHIELIDLSQN